MLYNDLLDLLHVSENKRVDAQELFDLALTKGLVLEKIAFQKEQVEIVKKENALVLLKEFNKANPTLAPIPRIISEGLKFQKVNLNYYLTLANYVEDYNSILSLTKRFLNFSPEENIFGEIIDTNDSYESFFFLNREILVWLTSQGHLLLWSTSTQKLKFISTESISKDFLKEISNKLRDI